jgi:hypothetical protein
VIQKKNSEIHIIDEMTVKVEETKRCWPHITDAFLFKLVINGTNYILSYAQCFLIKTKFITHTRLCALLV